MLEYTPSEHVQCFYLDDLMVSLQGSVKCLKTIIQLLL